jgi:hypothetical protein
MSVVIGTLTIDLKANTASFSQSMDKMAQLSAKSANDIKRSLEKIAVAGIAMAAAIATGTVALIKSSIDTAAALTRAAQAAGTTTERMSELNYAAKLNGISLETVTKGLEKLAQSSFKAQNGNVQLQRIFARLGVSYVDSSGHLKDSGVMMQDVAVKLAHMADGAGKTAIEMTLFGKGGAVLTAMLDEYGAKQAEVNEEAHRFGLVLSTSTGEIAVKAHADLEKLKSVFEGMGFSLMAETLPALEELLNKLVQLASAGNLQDLAKSFGGEVTKAIRFMGDALAFAVAHAHALKIALEALVAIQAGKIAIPIVADLATGGIAKAGEGVSRLAVSMLGLGRVLPQLTAFGSWVKYTTGFLKLMASEEGVAAAATYVLDGALALINIPLTLAVAAIAGITYACYKFRDAMFTLGGTTYELRDIWNAAWIVIGKALSWVGGEFLKLVNVMRNAWASFMAWFAGSAIVGMFKKWFGEALSWAAGILGKLTPKWAIDALDQAKAEREAKTTPTAPPPSARKAALPAADTSGLGKQSTDDPTGKLLADLQEKVAESALVVAASGMEEEAQRKVTAQNKASQEILKLGQEIAKQTHSQTKDYASLVNAATQAIIRQDNAQLSDNEAKAKLNDIIGVGSRATALSISQSGLMIEALNKGTDAVARQCALDEAWNELRAKGGSLDQVLARSAELYSAALAKENEEIAANVIGLTQELTSRKLVTAATLGTIDAQRAAAQAAKLAVLDKQIADAPEAMKKGLNDERTALVALSNAEYAETDAREALSLLSPYEQYLRETDALEHAVKALKDMENGQLSYGQQLQVAARQQDLFNKMIDQTVDNMLRQDSAMAGVDAFFLNMEKQAKTAASIVYDALNSTFTKLSTSLTSLITGGKADFGKMFKDIGKEMLDSSLKSGMQKGLGALAKSGVLGKLGSGVLGDLAAGKADGSKNSPFWVKMAEGGFGAGGLGEDAGNLGGGSGGGDGEDSSGSGSGGGFMGILGKLFGAFVTPHATGGGVSPGSAYLVGEQGPEILSGASGNITSAAASQRMLSGSSGGATVSYSIDARGTDPALTEQRTRQAIVAAHASAIDSSIRASAEQVKRVPARR